MRLDRHNPQTGRYLDTKGIWFSLKLVILIGIVGVSVYGLSDHTGQISAIMDNPSQMTAALNNLRNTQQPSASKTSDSRKDESAAESRLNLSIPQTGRAVLVSPQHKRVQLIQEAKLTHSFSITRINRTDGGCNITEGRFSIREKNSHFALSAHSYFPATLQMNDGVFIHGQPLTDPHVESASSTARHCIQLARKDAETLFSNVHPGTPVIIRGKLFETDTEAGKTSQVSDVSAPSYLIANLSEDKILAGRYYRWQRPIASLTKLMTAVVAKERFRQNSTIDVTQTAVETEGRRGRLRVGQKLSLTHIFHPLLLSSSNDAAAAIAEHVGQNTFITQMNKTAERIGMKNSRFVDPAGLAEQNTATALDLLKLTRYIYQHHPEIFRITEQKQKALPRSDSIAYDNYTNTHPMSGASGFAGGKNGWLPAAGHTNISLFETGMKENKDIIAIITLDSTTGGSDTQALLQWHQSNHVDSIARSNIQ